MSARLEFDRLDFELCALEMIRVPQQKAGNVLRGAFGTGLRKLVCEAQCSGARTCRLRSTCPYAAIFEPLDGPRPFVFRAAHLDGCTFAPGARFSFGINVFGQSESTHRYFLRVFELVASDGLGPSRGRASLTKFEQHRQCLPLESEQEMVSRIGVRFETPTELKDQNELIDQPRFAVLMQRIAERVNDLSMQSSDSPTHLDERGIGGRAARVRMTECRISQVKVERFSTKTGQTHPLGGFVGEAVYEGELAEFVPLLRAAEFTGVGRHTSWGNGQLRVTILG